MFLFSQFFSIRLLLPGILIIIRIIGISIYSGGYACIDINTRANVKRVSEKKVKHCRTLVRESCIRKNRRITSAQMRRHPYYPIRRCVINAYFSTFIARYFS